MPTTSAGLARDVFVGEGTGAPGTAEGWEHVQQSIGVILTTRIGERFMLREFGSEVPSLIGAPMTNQTILRVYAATVWALSRWEPRFAITSQRLSRAEPTGILEHVIFGDHMPRGHLGDTTVEGQGLRAIVTYPV